MQASSAMDTDATEAPSHASITASSLPEVEVFASLLAIIYLVDQKDYQQVGAVLGSLIWSLCMASFSCQC